MKTVLIFTNRYDSHADYLIRMFWDRDVPFMRLNTDDFPLRSSASFHADTEISAVIDAYGEKLTPDDVRSLWFRRPSVFAIDESMGEDARTFAKDECRAFVDGFLSLVPEQRWVSLYDNIRRAGRKILQLKVARDLGFSIPDTLVTSSPEEFLMFWDRHEGEVIYKALGKNMVLGEDGILFAYTNKLDEAFLERVGEIRLAPCLFQKYVEKDIELRITVVEDEVFSCAIHSQESERTKIDWRHYDLENTPHTIWDLPPEIQEKCVETVKHFGLRFGTIDMILTPGGEYVFVEINPNGQWLWIEHLTDLPISEALFSLLTK